MRDLHTKILGGGRHTNGGSLWNMAVPAGAVMVCHLTSFDAEIALSTSLFCFKSLADLLGVYLAY